MLASRLLCQRRGPYVPQEHDPGLDPGVLTAVEAYAAGCPPPSWCLETAPGNPALPSLRAEGISSVCLCPGVWLLRWEHEL